MARINEDTISRCGLTHTFLSVPSCHPWSFVCLNDNFRSCSSIRNHIIFVSFECFVVSFSAFSIAIGPEVHRRNWNPIIQNTVPVLVVCVALAFGGRTSGAADAPVLPSSSVGMPVAIEQLVLPGSELEVAPITDKSRVVIRIDK